MLLVDGQHRSELTDLGIGPPRRPLRDRGHCVDGEFAAPERFDTFGEVVDAFGGVTQPAFVLALAGDEASIGSHDLVMVRRGGAPSQSLGARPRRHP